MKRSNITKGIAKILGVLLLLLLFTGAGAADTTSVSPSVTLTFDNVPDAVINGASVTVNAAATLTDDMKKLLKEENAHIENVAYVVKLSPNGISKTDIRSTQIQLPASQTWAATYTNVYTAAIDQNTVQIYDAIKTGSAAEPSYLTNIQGLPDYVLLIAMEDGATPGSASSPAPFLGLLAGLAAALFIQTRRG